MLDTLTERVHRTHRAHLRLTPHARTALRDAALAHLDHGGRGIGTAVETRLTNPLARRLFTDPPPPGATLTVTALTHDTIGHDLHLEHR